MLSYILRASLSPSSSAPQGVVVGGGGAVVVVVSWSGIIGEHSGSGGIGTDLPIIKRLQSTDINVITFMLKFRK